MTRTYDIIDADGHVLEPVTLWDTYIDPAYRGRAPRLIVDTDGKERLLVEGRLTYEDALRGYFSRLLAAYRGDPSRIFSFDEIHRSYI